jgi:Tol biopolymer transport system component
MFGRFRSAAAVAGVALVVAMLAGEGQAAFPGHNGLIAFMSTQNGPSDVYVMSPSGAGQKRLTTGGVNSLSWSADGTKIAFTSSRDGNPEIYVMNADGSNQTRLTFTPTAFEIFPAWSPDGTKIVFASFVGTNYDLWVMNADGSGRANITNHPADEINPVWHPDGSRIVFETTRDGNREIYTVQPDGSAPTNISNRPAMVDTEPDWSPDGTKILFVSRAVGTPVQLWLMNADGSNPVALTSFTGNQMPSFSPDGTRIAFTTFRDGNPEIYVMNADGSNQTRLTSNLSADILPDWQPLADPPPVNVPPLVSAGGPYTAVEGSPVAISGVADDPEGDPLTGDWTATRGPGTDPGAGCIFSSRNAIAATSATCSDDGIFIVTLTVEDGHNLVRATTTLTVANASPNVSIFSPADGATVSAGQLFGVAATVSDPGFSDLPVCSVDWGDGSTTAPVPIFSGTCAVQRVYPDSSVGTRTITVTVSDDDGGSATDSITIAVRPLNQRPEGNAGGPYTGTEGTPIAIVGTASDPDGDPLSASWTATALPGATDAGASCSFANPAQLETTVTCTDDGNYHLNLVITDGRGGVELAIASLTIANAAPTVTITVPAAGASVPAGLGFDVGAQIADAGANDALSCTIDWGDGNSDQGHITGDICMSSHVYLPPIGAKSVTVTVSDDDGESASDSMTVVVNGNLIKVTADGSLSGNVSFSLVARGSGALSTNGQLQAQLPGSNRFDGNAVDFITYPSGLIGDNMVSWSGSGLFNGVSGYTFKATVVDNGQGGGANKTPDTISLLIRDSSGSVVFSTHGHAQLKSGNVQIH